MQIHFLEDNVKQDVVNKVNKSVSLRRQSKQLIECAKRVVDFSRTVLAYGATDV